MSAPAWLLDVIHGTESAPVLIVPNTENQPWVQSGSHETLINNDFVNDVLSVPTVPKETQSPSNEFEKVRSEREQRRSKVMAMLEDTPSTRYALLVENDSTDPVVVAVGIRKIATFEMEIPQMHYDGMVLLELIEKYSGEKYENN